MLSYLTAETSFLRSFGNRSLLLLVLCVLTRSGESVAKGSGIGVALDINPAVIVVFGPVLALILLVSLKLEADTLLLARETALDETISLQSEISPWLYLLFSVPAASAAFMAVQFMLKLVPSRPGCDNWSAAKQLSDTAFQGGSASVYCIGNLKQGTPWIYPPAQTYLYIACVAACAYLTWRIAIDWAKARGAVVETKAAESQA
ncbi:hypothetical protein [Bradyrhizobium sp.]|uniref:hypothetical protein n=1 Tax=Bradyrhizobium sp. TaxID=376 RepID=UPI003C3EB08E